MNPVDYFHLEISITSRRVTDATMPWPAIIIQLVVVVISALGRSGEGFVVQDGDCNFDLGMESGKIQDHQLSASSSFEWKVVGPQNSRIRHDKEGGAWCPANPVTKNSRDWLEVDLIHLHVITGVEVQGRFGGGQGQEFVEWFMLEYKRKNRTSWMKIDQIFPGNSNTYVAERRSLNRPIVASDVRFLPAANHTRTVCLRIELYGCPWPSGLLTYNMPQGHLPNLNLLKSKSLEAIDLTDTHYDGSIINGILENGIGCLVDGVTSGKYPNPYDGWMGWSKQELNQGPLWVEFFFDDLRCFEFIDVYVLEGGLKQAGVFQKVVVYFSTDRFVHTPRKIVFEPNLDEPIDGVRIVRIQLGGEVARSLKIIMFLRSDWLLISEVQFSSNVVNTTDECRRKTIAPINRAPLGFNSYLLLTTCSIMGSLCAVVAIAMLIRRRKSEGGGAYKDGIDQGSRKLTEELLSMHRDASKNSIFSWDTCEYGEMESLEQEEGSKINDETLEGLLERKLPDLPRIMDWSGFYDGSHKYTRPRVVENYFGDKVASSSPSPLRRFYPTILYHDGSQSPTSGDERISRHAFRVVSSNPGLDIGGNFNSDDNTSTSMESNITSRLKDEWKVERNGGVLDKTSSVISMSKYFLRSQDQLIHLPREKLIYLSRIGEGPFGEICLCEMVNQERSHRKKVALKLLKNDKCEMSKNIFLEEAKLLSRLKNRNIVRLVGVCIDETPHCLAMEYLHYGNLKNFLQQFSGVIGKVRDDHVSLDRETSYDTLLYFGHQISCGMTYLESQRVIHRDLAARNCLVGKRGLVKISDFGMSRYLECGSKFYQIQGMAVLPIRWMAWESVFLGMFTSKSDVWSFGITMWEILTLGKLQPYGSMSDEEVVENCQSFFNNQSNQSILSLKPPTHLYRPSTCSEQLFSVMLTCWHGRLEQRPAFSDLRNELFKLYDMGVVMLDVDRSQSSWQVSVKSNEYFSSIAKQERLRMSPSEVSESSSDGRILTRIESLLMATDDDNTGYDDDDDDHKDGDDNDVTLYIDDDDNGGFKNV